MSSTIVAFGEALWDLLPTGPVLGGAPLNFAYRVNSLGHRSIIVSRLGQDDLGQRAREQIVTLGMSDSGLQWDKTYPTGTVEIYFDEDKIRITPSLKMWPMITLNSAPIWWISLNTLTVYVSEHSPSAAAFHAGPCSACSQNFPANSNCSILI